MDAIGEDTLKKMNALPKGWLPEKNEFKVFFEGGAYGGMCKPNLREEKRFLFKHCNGYSSPPLKIYHMGEDLYKKHEEISEERENLEREMQTVVIELNGILGSFNTTKQLCEAWPEVSDIVQNMFGDDTSASKAMLPAVNLSVLNEKLGIEMTELKPCPFCGSKAAIWTHNDINNKFLTIGCSANDSSCHGEEGVIDDWCPINCESSITKELAVEAWNTRADHTENLLNEMENLAKALEDVAEIPQSYFDAINKARGIE